MESIIFDTTTNPCSEVPRQETVRMLNNFRSAELSPGLFEERDFQSGLRTFDLEAFSAMPVVRRDTNSAWFELPFSRPYMSESLGRLSDFRPRSAQDIYEIGNPNPIHFIPGREEEYMTRAELNRMSPRARTIYSIISCLESYLKHDSLPLEFTIASLRNQLYVLQDSIESEGQREPFNLTLYDNLFGTEDNALTINMENFKRLCCHCR